MHFGNPEYFLFLLLIPVLIAFFIWAYQRRLAALQRFASLPMIKRLTPTSVLSRQVVKWTMFLSFFLFLVFALVRPRFGVNMELVERKGVDIMVALDISESMLAEDIAPNRIDRAKHEISKLIDLLRGDRFGLVVFAGESFVQCPLTLDYGAAKMFLNAVSTGWVEVQGTDVAEAIRQTDNSFKSKAHKHKVMILLTDGEENQGSAIDAARQAAADGIVIYTVGIGSESGVPIPVSKGNGNVVYKKDKSGDLVMTRLNSVMLEKIALETHGKYFHAGTDLDLVQIYSEISKMEKQDLGSSKVTTYQERYQIFLFIALLFLIVEFFVSERINVKQQWRGKVE